MRTIKFRAFNKNKKEMFDPVGEMDLNQEGIMQFTGLLDRNGKEIYEGDIVKKNKGSYTIDIQTKEINNNSEGVFEIKYNQLHCCFGLFLYGSFRDTILASEYDDNGKINKEWVCNDIEVIGNVYENPNLLK